MPRRSRNTSFWLACVLVIAVIGCAKDVTDYSALRLVISSEPPLQPGATISSLQLAVRSPDGLLKMPAPGNEADLTFALPAGRNIVTTPYTIDLAQPSGSAGRMQLRVLGVDKKQVLTAWSGVVDTRTTGTLELTLRAPQASCDADGDGVPDCHKPGCCTDPDAPSDCNDDGTPDKNGVPKGFASSPFNTENPCTQCGNGIDEDCDGTDLACVDTDKDGVPDCQETACPPGAASDPTVYPGAPEICDGKDNDCNLLVDDALATASDPSPTHQAGEGCGLGVCAGGVWQCDPTGVKKPMLCSTDSKKAAKEDCTNDTDDDCDGKVNQGCELLDIDGDGVNNDVEKAKCAFKFAMYHAEFYPPDAPEKCCPFATVDTTICDTNCDGKTTPCDPTDKDGDGWPAKKDCDDNDPLTYLGAPEKCGDGKVQSCQGGDPPCDARDKDGDGWMPPTDCDDNDKAVNPEAKEVCNGRDDNCNGIIDDGNPEGLDAPCGNLNGECGHVGDKYGQPTGTSVCKHYKFGQEPGGPLDCASSFDVKSGTCVGCDGDQRPQAETCNGKDDNCNAKTDEAFSYTQEDGTKIAIGGACDGVGACGIGVVECKNTGSAACSSDPDGSKPQSGPETCNNIDDNCNGKTDENLATLADSTCQKVGVCAAALSKIQTVCNAGVWICDYSQVPGIEISSDLQDVCAVGDALCACTGSPPVCHKLVESSCDGKDNDCDGKTDDDFGYLDYDGVAVRTIGQSCLTGACAGGSVVCAADKSGVTCSTLGKVKTEQCNLVDDNCNGVTDEAGDLPVEKSTCKQVGVCAVTKPQATCADGGWLCNYSGVPKWESPKEATCDGLDNDCNGITDDGCDDDGDGFCDGAMGWTAGAVVTCKKSTAVNLLDCDDAAAAVFPGAVELCNNVDDNCNGETDEGCDRDKDGYCDATMVWMNAPTVCPLSTSATVVDCDDDNANVHPFAAEICNNIDDNCTAGTDEGCDDDGDSYCDAAIALVGTPAICAYGGGDCNDANAAIHPGAIELCDDVDNDCNAIVDDNCDGDGDGFCDAARTTIGTPKACPQGGGDCNDGNAAIHPGASDICDNIDNDCNGVTDDACDVDGDGYCTAKKVTIGKPATCPYGGLDCNDADQSVHPNATETCNGVDDNCNGETDEGVQTTFYWDGDGDGFGDTGNPTLACQKPAGYATVGGDCDDSNASIHPGAPETCNGKDDNCDGTADEGVKSTFYLDGDGDGFGLASATTEACSLPAGYATIAQDCNDSNSQVHPGASEICNGIDDDCNGVTDGPNSGGCAAYFLDGDGDGYGPIGGATVCLCAGTVQNPTKVGGDCNDSNPSVHPGATETCNGVDDNCNGVTDEGVKSTFYQDSDGDTFGNAAVTQLACTAPTGYVSDATDCNDASASVHPGATESCNGVDDNCNGVTDENVGAGSACSNTNVFGTCVGVKVCNGIAGLSCTASTPAADICNGADDNCNGQTDEGDPGGGVPCDTGHLGVCSVGMTVCTAGAIQCKQNVQPAVETCNGVDDNCNGLIDDGNPGGGVGCSTGNFGVCASGTTQCAAGSLQCKQNVVAGPELCDGKDNNCDGVVDEGNPGGGQACGTGLSGVCGAGSTVCTAGAITCAQTIAASAETCDGQDNNCNGVTDEGFNIGASCGLGACSGGQFVCAASHTSSHCSTDANAMNEVCNGKDDNCNGTVDEGDPGGGGACDTGKLGVCGPGTMHCQGGALQCIQKVQPSAELCDGKDNNCDGVIDEGNPGGGGLCSTGLAGICAGGTVQCTAGALHCVQILIAGAEVCNGLDDNCNGIVDEGNPGGGQACGTGLLGVCSAGTTMCASGALGCSQSVQPSAEVCDGLDNNCNGAVDDGDPGGGAGCSTGLLGVCAAGVVHCSGGADQCIQTVASSAEICDGLDNNCDGETDAADPGLVLRLCEKQAGVCAGAEKTALLCSLGSWLPCSDANYLTQSAAYAVTDICGDGLDNDCNGLVDDGCP